MAAASVLLRTELGFLCLYDESSHLNGVYRVLLILEMGLMRL